MIGFHGMGVCKEMVSCMSSSAVRCHGAWVRTGSFRLNCITNRASRRATTGNVDAGLRSSNSRIRASGRCARQTLMYSCIGPISQGQGFLLGTANPKLGIPSCEIPITNTPARQRFRRAAEPLLGSAKSSIATRLLALGAKNPRRWVFHLRGMAYDFARSQDSTNSEPTRVHRR